MIPTFVEAARALGEAALRAEPTNDQAAIDWAFRRVLARDPDSFEVEILRRQLELARKRFMEKPDQVDALLDVGESISLVTDEESRTELAALTTVMNVILNLDETLNLQ